ncbi:MAG: peptide chain release factor N(5)-glutamine methyltransferase [Clostridia bacterium]|nr:peptide chain release factor N(5)-glutamine methyltransferase [Clostridia bacterium]
MRLREVLSEGIKKLKDSNIESPAVNAGAILCFVLNCDKSFLYAHDDYNLKEQEQNLFNTYIEERVKGKPLQYIVGRQEFMSLVFKVAPGVLIPRQDTEVLVESVIKHAELFTGKGIEILDIGTGSGCIAVSLAHFIKDSRVTALDVSDKALEIARLNADSHDVGKRIRFVQSNLFDNLDKKELFDIIVSNPPYIPEWEIQSLMKEVKEYEPMCALSGGEDGLDFYRAIVANAPKFLKPDGLIALEVGIRQADLVMDLMRRNFYAAEKVCDLAGIERVVLGRLQP